MFAEDIDNSLLPPFQFGILKKNLLCSAILKIHLPYWGVPEVVFQLVLINNAVYFIAYYCLMFIATINVTTKPKNIIINIRNTCFDDVHGGTTV